MAVQSLAWGILGCGSIAGKFARDLPGSRTGRLAAVASRSGEKATAFAAKWGGEAGGVRAYGSYEAMLADPKVGAVYVATPHTEHARWAITAMNAGKHVLCEKPMAVHAYDVEAMVEAARANGVVLLEAYMYRLHPQIAKLVELVRSGAIGEVRVIQASFGFRTGTFDPESRLLKNELAGGGILDVGGYPVSLARLVAGAAAGKPFADPVEVKAAGHLESTGVDGYAAAVLKFPGDLVAQVATGVRVGLDNAARVFGTEGWILLPHPWGLGGDAGGAGKIVVHKGGKAEEILVPSERPLYAYEADAVAEAVGGEVAAPGMTLADSIGQARTLDQWRREVGVRYVMERAEGLPAALPRPAKRVRPVVEIPKGEVAYVGKPVSRLVMGAMMASGQPAHAAVILDAYFESGGNCIDTAHIYGQADRSIGAYLKSRGNRAETVVIAKGAHTPECTPEGLTRQLGESLGNLGSDYADIYIMHRDNPAVPVGEFVDVLNEHVSAGRIKSFGGSNWTVERFQAANAYAAKAGKQPFTMLNNNFSLARMVNPVWDGCIAASDAGTRAWLTRTGTPHFAWSSQARGFFVRGAPGDRRDWELARCWYSDDNFERLKRARELGEKYGVTANNVALAYCLRQPFPQFCLVGPATLEEFRTTLPALGVGLTEGELRWVNLEEGAAT